MPRAPGKPKTTPKGDLPGKVRREWALRLLEEFLDYAHGRLTPEERQDVLVVAWAEIGSSI